ncbi:hypothetical protein K7432_003920 [Basidiobolus ranarum]|uniref:Fungal lipase-type domain-containing protein n=1 Tax=Basidiobolus ranarum TaxID=34480 RepID=A0ABR2WZ34_9FUNG
MKLGLLLTLAVGLANNLVLAAPIANKDMTQSNTQVMDQETVDMLMQHSVYTAASYCPETSLKTWKCGRRCQGNVRVKSYLVNDLTDMAGYIGVDDDNKNIYVVFRGSSNRDNWAANFDFLPTVYNYSDEVKNSMIHSGFNSAYLSLRSNIREDLVEISNELGVNAKDYDVVVLGHSLGGAVAVLAAMDVKKLTAESSQSGVNLDTNRVYLHTYGQPRIGNEAFGRLVFSTLAGGELGNKAIRVTYEADPVPQLLPVNFGYTHGIHEAWIHNNQTLTCNDLVNGTITEDPHCNAGVGLPNFDDHRQYYVPMEC